MSDVEEVTGSQATSKHKLVDTITVPELAWVAPEPRGIASTITAQDPRLFTIVEEVGSENWEVHMPAEGERVCSSYAGCSFTMYEMAFKELGFRLPFNDLEAGIFGRLRVAPSQLHPNSLAFIRAYQILCRYLEVEATVALFFYIFQIQRQRVGDRQGWISLKHQSSKIFRMFVESARGFKERYYVVRALTEFAEDSLHMEKPVFNEDGTPQLDEEGGQVTEWVLRFPLSWSSEHFDLRTDEYLTAAEDLSPAEMAGFQKLQTYVDGFKPCKVMTSLGEVALDKHGQPRTEPRFVNTKLLLSCKTVSAEDTLLGRMADLASELVRIAAEQKGEKARKKARRAKPTILMGDQGASGSVSQSSPVGSSAGTPAGRAKMHREEQMTPIVDLSEGDGGFVLPACLSNRGFFDKNPLQVPVSEKKYILGASASARQKQLNEDVATVIRLAETALVLNEGGPTHEVEKLAARNAKLEGKIVLMEGELIDLRGKQENYGNLLEDVRLTRDELKETKKKLEDVETRGAEEKKQMEEVIADLQSKLAPAADEGAEISKMVSRADLVKEIKRQRGLMLASMVHGWKNAIAQLRVVNAERDLITEGIHKLKRVENGQIVIPEEYREMELEEEKLDEEVVDDEDEEDEEVEEEVVGEERAPEGNPEGHDESS
ncbi:uncharacterized protein LOC123891775 [Trifolium pratense]|uniref:Uncharacterized protein n=1 Tax=Trifolium pratense TaxID=57577 RepID=A0ACB0LQW5_TRIPR|nr:uncharacterized protein LOC123891775 [Trifolium pratense]CAJ2671871.1 unnamed protein product [Trifolium pratense]